MFRIIRFTFHNKKFLTQVEVAHLLSLILNFWFMEGGRGGDDVITPLFAKNKQEKVNMHKYIYYVYVYK